MNSAKHASIAGDAAALATSLLIAGAAATVIGTITLMWPDATMLALAWLIGVHLVIAGVTLATATGRSVGQRWPARFNFGILVSVSGAFTLVWPGATVRTLALLFGFAVTVAGASFLISGLVSRPRLQASAWLVATGVIGISAGVTAVLWSDVTVEALATLVGLSLAAHGVVLLVASWRVRCWMRRRAQIRTAVAGLEVRLDRIEPASGGGRR